MYQKYGIQLKPVEESDAEFIIELRTNDQKSRFISATNPDVAQQKEWIKNYKIKEKKGEEFYFIALDENNEKFATYRIYNFQKNSVEIGSFVSKPNYDKPINIVKLDIMIKEYVFNVLQLENLHFEVRKLNVSVVKYHKKFYPKITGEDELNYYFSLNKNDFERGKQNFIKMLN